MNEYIIEPWDHLVDDTRSETDLEQYVPPELEQLARQVMTNYDMHVSGMTLITSKPDKGGAIWQIETNHGSRSIKVLHRQPQRSLFSVGAQEYLVQQKARVPGLIPTKDNQLYVVEGGKMWIVTEWVSPLEQTTKIDLEGAAPLCYGLGEFHHHTKGYIPPYGAAKSSRIYSWEKHYDKMVKKIGWFRDIASVFPETTASSLLLSVIDKYEDQAIEMFNRFKESPYKRMINKGEAYWGLAHQDYGWSNGQLGPGGIWVIDLDGVAYDLPIRDLRKIITSTMDDMATWDINWIRGVIDAYHQANPIDQEMFEILWIDMAFPNEFYKHVKEIVFEPALFMNNELEAIIQRIELTETNKWQVLSELAKDKEKYLPGDYPEEAAAIIIEPAAPSVVGNFLFNAKRPTNAYQITPPPEPLIADQSHKSVLPVAVTNPNVQPPLLVDIVKPNKNKQKTPRKQVRKVEIIKDRETTKQKKSKKQMNGVVIPLKATKPLKEIKQVKKMKKVKTVIQKRKTNTPKQTRQLKTSEKVTSTQKAKIRTHLKNKTVSIKSRIWSTTKKGVYFTEQRYSTKKSGSC